MNFVEACGVRLYAEENGCVAIEMGCQSWRQRDDFTPCVVLPDGERLAFSEAKSEMLPMKSGVGSGFCWRYEWGGRAGRLKIETQAWVEASSGDVRLTLLPLEDAPIKEVHWPPPFVFDERGPGVYTVLPMMQGCLVPNGWPKKIKGIEPQNFCERHGYMPWLGQIRGPGGYLAIAETEWDAGYNVEHPAGGPTQLHFVWRESMGALSYPRRIRLRLIEGGYVELCKAYRSYLRERGRARTLAEKIARQPKIARLKGASVVHTEIKFDLKPESILYDPQDPGRNFRIADFDARAKQFKALADRGVQKAYVHLDGWGTQGYDRMHPDVLPPCPDAGGAPGLRRLAQACRSLGYLFCLHDQYRDYYTDAQSYDEQNAVLDTDGKRPRVCIWNGGDQSFLCAALAFDYARRNYRALDSLGIPIDGAYLDVFSIVELDECLDPRHPMTRRECSEYRNACFDYITERYGLVSSEEPLSSTVDSLALCHYAPYPTAPKLNGGESRGIPVPLFNLVFHDCIFTPWDLNEGDRSTMPDRRSGFLYALLNAGMGYLPIEPAGWELEKAMIVARLHERLALAEMVSHEFIEGDLERQRALYSNGAGVEVDFRANTWAVHYGGELPR